MIQFFGRDPILCKCGYVMKYENTFDPFKGRTINDRHFRKNVMKTSDEWEEKVNSATMTDEEWMKYICSRYICSSESEKN